MKLHNTEINTHGMELSKTAGYKVPTRNYEMANDQHVRTIELYPDSSNVLFYDAEHTRGIDKAELARQFANGILIVTSAGKVMPTAVNVGDTYTTVTAGSDSYYSVEKS